MISRTYIHQLETVLSELERLASHHEVPREFLKSLHHALPLNQGDGLSDDQSRERLDNLREFRIRPTDRN